MKIFPPTILRPSRAKLLQLCCSLLACLNLILPTGEALAGGQAPRWWYLRDLRLQHLPLSGEAQALATQAMAQDRQGFLWLGTQNGLARWDGYRFKFWHYDVNNPRSLPPGVVFSLHVDQAGRLWVGTGNGGLARFDAEKEDFERFSLNLPGIEHTNIYALADDGNNRLWFSNLRQLAYLDLRSGKAVAVNPLKDHPTTKRSSAFMALLFDHKQRLWIGSAVGLIGLDVSSGKFQLYQLPGNKTLGVSAICESADGSLWIGTDHQGLYRFDPGSAGFSLQNDSGGNINPAEDLILKLEELDNGQLWAGTVYGGLLMRDIASGHMRRELPDPARPQGVQDLQTSAMFKDNLGQIWLGGNHSLSRFLPAQGISEQIPLRSLQDPATAQEKNRRPRNVQGIQQLPDGRIWLGLVQQGNHLLHPHQAVGSDFKPQVSVPGKTYLQDWPISVLQAVHALEKDKFLIAGLGGLVELDSSKMQAKMMLFADKQPLDRVNAIFADGPKLWLATNLGLLSLQRRGQDNLWQQVPATDGLPLNNITAGNHDDLWLASNVGLYRYRRGSGQLQQIKPSAKNGLHGEVITSILYDSRGWLWVGTLGQGLSVLQPQNDGVEPRFQHLGTARGLPHDVVDKILEDDKGYIWISTDGGIARIEAPSMRILNLNESSDLTNFGFWVDNGIKSSSGELIFAGANGLTVIHPERFKRWQFMPQVVLTRIKAGAREVIPGPYNQEPRPVLQLQAQETQLLVEFAALDLSAPEKNRYAYKLEGFDKNWNQTDANQRLANYTNLPPGRYQLRIRGSNRSGLTSSRERVLQVQVLPAWYQTWWFFSLLASAGSACMFGMVQLRTRYLRRRQQELEIQVAQRSSQLQQAQQQLVQQEKLAALGGMVAGIAHEINTPLGTTLTAISGLQGILTRVKQALASGTLSKPQLEGATHEADEYLHLAQDSARRAADLVIAFKSVAAEDGRSSRENIDLTIYLPEILSLFQSKLEQSGHQILSDIEDGLLLRTSPPALYAVLTRILSNIQDHAFHGSPRPGIVNLRAWRENKEVCLEISDNGVGIAQADLERVFEPFFTTRGGSGGHVGLGLHVAYNHILQIPGASIHLHSQAGSGTTVLLRFADQPN